MRKCKTCGENKKLSEFVKHAKSKGGYRHKCRVCAASYKKAWRNAKKHNYGKEVLPPGFNISGVSQLIDGDGNTKLQWVKSKADKTAQTEHLLDSMRGMLEEYKGVVKAKKINKNIKRSNLMSVLPIGDAHFGLHCWHEEVGENFDLKIAKENSLAAVKELYSVSPYVDTALIINLGDYFHADNDRATTTKGTPVDVDGRRVEVVKVGLAVLVQTVHEALTRARQVRVICVTGNHDGESSKMLSLMLSLMFSDEPRVSVDTAPTKFHRFQFGKVLIGTTHGDTGKDADLPMIMATDWKKEWSECDYFHWYKGHVHHDTVKEYTGGVIVETFRTLAMGDRWHNGQGYRSGRDIKLDIWDGDFGHIQRYIVGIKKIANNIKRDEK